MIAAPADDGERLARLRLFRTDHVGPVTFVQLLRRFGSAAEALRALPDLARRGGRASPLSPCPRERALQEMEALARLGARLLHLGAPDYPQALAAVAGAPPVLAVRGPIDLAARLAIAVVGARNASANGVRFARLLAAELGQGGAAVVSGLARGIDTGAHEGSIATGTVAVLAGGVDHVFPPENARLYERIVAEGAVVSEMPPGIVPHARHFPQRNRIIAGLALGTVVVEAAPRSGSLITARLANEYGREVFAVPGSPLDPRARGTNDLIRQGATLVESADDVFRVVSPQALAPARPAELAPSAAEAPENPAEIAAAREILLEKLGSSPTPVDELVRQCQMSPAAVMAALLELELAGRLSRHPGNQVSLVQ